MRLNPVLLTLLVGLAACEAGEESAPAVRPSVETSAASASSELASPAPVARISALSATGPAATIAAEEGSALQTAASVVRVDPLARQSPLTVKLFGMGGGDPAMNGLQTYLAVFRSPADGWVVFRLGDVLDYRVLSEAPGRVDLEITESRLDDGSGEIGQGTRRIIVGWPVSTDGEPPAAITVTPAR